MIEKLLKILEGHDKSKKIPGTQLAAKMDITLRKLRDYVEEARRRGVPIGSSWRVGDNGYWLIQDPIELAGWIADRHRWMSQMRKTIENMKKYYYQIGGQQSLLDQLIEKQEEN